MTFHEFFLTYNEKLWNFLVVFICPSVICEDGFAFSAQAGRGMYSTPRETTDSENYTEFELAYLSSIEESLLPFAEDQSEPTSTNYDFVPLKNIEEIVAKHGGINKTYIEELNKIINVNGIIDTLSHAELCQMIRNT